MSSAESALAPPSADAELQAPDDHAPPFTGALFWVAVAF